MSAGKRKGFLLIVWVTIGWPLFWGLAATCGFYLLLGLGIISSPLAHRYFAGHPVEFVETGLFFIGLSAIVMKVIDLAGQFRHLSMAGLPAVPAGGQPPEDAERLLAATQSWPAKARQGYLGRRLQEGLEYVHRRGNATQLDEHLKYLADVDAQASHEDYSLVRMVIWATPMLGFLGTVIGITLALGDLSPEALVSAPKQAMDGLLGGLSVAFDTTALALSLSILLMFAQFLSQQIETQLISIVDRRSTQELVGRFQELGGGTDPHLESIQRMSNRVIESVGQLVQRQAEVWQASMREAQQHWRNSLQTSQTAVEAGFQQALKTSMTNHAEALIQAEQMANQRSTRQWERMQKLLSDNGRQMASQQAELVKQAEVLQNVLSVTGEVVRLEDALNRNLGALAGAKNFEDTVMSLSATIHLLNSRLGVSTPPRRLASEDHEASAKEGAGKGRAA